MRVAWAWRRPFEPLAFLIVALVAPLTVAGWLVNERQATGSVTPPASVPHATALASTHESRALSPLHWLELALEAPRSFRRALGWCEQQSEAPLPNCRNVVVADRVCRVLGSNGLWGEGDG